MSRKPNSLSLRDVIIGFIASVIATVIGGAIVGEGRFSNFNPTPIQWAALGVFAVITVGVIAMKWRSTLKLLQMLGSFVRAARRWIISNWQLVIGLLLLFGVACGAYVLMDTPWAALLTLGLALATTLLARYCTRSRVEGLGYQEGLGKDLLERIEFGYTGSPAEHGWQISDGQDAEPPTFKSIPYGLVAMEIKSVSGRAMDYQVKPSAEPGSLIEFVAKYEERSVVYARLRVRRGDIPDESKEVWLAFLAGEAEPSRTSEVEWSFPVKPTQLEGSWSLFQIDLDEAVKQTFGRENWSFAKLEGFRLRGSLSMAHISVFKAK